jgi:hypothetical protein
MWRPSTQTTTDSIEDAVRFITRSINTPPERREFLAKTISVGAVKGDLVVSGSPVYIAIGDYEPQ